MDCSRSEGIVAAVGLGTIMINLKVGLILYQLLSSVKNSPSEPPPKGHFSFEPHIALGTHRGTQSDLSVMNQDRH